MKFTATNIEGVTVVETQPQGDARGSFRRVWCQRTFQKEGLPAQIVQSSLSVNTRRGTLRGMHFQLPPSREDKLVQCVTGAIYDVALDLRPKSRTFLGHCGIELSQSNNRALFIPSGCAHGFITLDDSCTVLYMMTDFYAPELSSGVRWNDPAFEIEWPVAPTEILPRDASYPDFDPKLVAPFAAS
ncbi:MAG TPA: dTDP-4-dehydrorhamnose 3,5-epimerase [Fimbriimonadaceae bacterium]|nr:dTDP-4-dehydrorhamnose 3,5-epimerase [Fimbriimonadaceae bacterium]